VDVLALVGDAVDNVPGVPGIGEKGARDLVRQFGPLEAVLENAEAVKRASYREGLKAHRDNALLSKRLVTLRRDAPVSLDIAALECRAVDRTLAHALFTELEFAALAREFAPELTAAPAEALEIVADEAALARLVASVEEHGSVALSLLATERAPMSARVVGIALAWGERAAYVPLLGAAFETPALPPDRVLAGLAPLFATPAVRKTALAGKRDRILLARLGLVLAGLDFDALLASYLLNPGRRHYSLDDLAVEFLGERGAGAVEPTGAEIPPLAAASQATGAEARLLARLAGPVRARLETEGVLEIFETMELPLVGILADMELAGVKIDVALLRSMSADMQRQIEGLTKEIFELAKGEFNVNSPPQLREILFDRLGLRAGKKTAKTRAASTAEDVLEELALEHPLPRKILEYRSVQKLKSTYVDALPELVDATTGRIHASFNQAVAATGRISSSDPNLQNIPIRTAEGRRIREAFIAEPGFLLLSADYSQIELRVLAHLSKDETLVETFRRGEDVHDRTSAEIFGPLSAVPRAEQRRVSKMINYALLYGKTAFTLAKDLGIPKKQAEEFIETYFARYPGVQRFIDKTVEDARRTGTVRTLFGRLRRLPDLQAKNFQIRMEAERQARNTPVQGSAADLIKKAMIELAAALAERRMGSRIILQIHDELLLEVPEAEAEAARKLVIERMEHAFGLDVPLVVDARFGRNWAEAH
jgi:DNA polymerase-1